MEVKTPVVKPASRIHPHLIQFGTVFFLAVIMLITFAVLSTNALAQTGGWQTHGIPLGSGMIVTCIDGASEMTITEHPETKSADLFCGVAPTPTTTIKGR